MTAMTTLQDRPDELMQAMKWTQQDVMRISGQSSSVVSQWRGKGTKLIKTIGKIAAAEALSRASGYSALWIATGAGPKRVESSGSTAHSPPAPPYTVDPGPRWAVDVLAAALDELDLDQRTLAANALQTLALAPDSIKARAAVATALKPKRGKELATGT